MLEMWERIHSWQPRAIALAIVRTLYKPCISRFLKPTYPSSLFNVLLPSKSHNAVLHCYCSYCSRRYRLCLRLHPPSAGHSSYVQVQLFRVVIIDFRLLQNMWSPASLTPLSTWEAARPPTMSASATTKHLSPTPWLASSGLAMVPTLLMAWLRSRPSAKPLYVLVSSSFLEHLINFNIGCDRLIKIL